MSMRDQLTIKDGRVPERFRNVQHSVVIEAQMNEYEIDEEGRLLMLKDFFHDWEGVKHEIYTTMDITVVTDYDARPWRYMKLWVKEGMLCDVWVPTDEWQIAAHADSNRGPHD